MKNPMVTVLMPVHNGEKYLSEAIESILHQTLRDFEFLIIDDCSTDCSADIVKSYNDERIIFESNVANRGISFTLNKGILMARGEYIARMDCDDISLPERLERQVEFMKNRRDVAVCGTWFEHFGSINGLARPLAEESEEINCRLLFDNALAHPTILLRRDIMLENNFFYDVSFVIAQDYDLWVTMSRKFKLANIQEVLLRYRTHDLQISGHRAELRKKEASLIRARQLHGLLPDVIEKETVLFNSVVDKSVGTEPAVLEDVGFLFEKILAANKLKKIYDQDMLYDILFRAWWRLCNLSCIEGLDAWRTYRKSSLRARKFDSLKLLLKCWMRYGK